MQWKVITSQPANCEAEARYRGYVVSVVGNTKPDASGWTVAVALRKLAADGRVGRSRWVLNASRLSARDRDDVFAQGFALAMSHIDVSVSPERGATFDPLR